MADQEPVKQEAYTGTPNEPAPQSKPKANEDPRQGLPDTVKVEEASAPMNLKPGDPNAKGPYIQYNGVATVRIMNEEDWKRVGVDSTNYYEWSYLNQKRIPRSSFTDAELQYLLRQDDRFSLVEDEPKKEDTTK